MPVFEYLQSFPLLNKLISDAKIEEINMNSGIRFGVKFVEYLKN